MALTNMANPMNYEIMRDVVIKGNEFVLGALFIVHDPDVVEMYGREFLFFSSNVAIPVWYVTDDYPDYPDIIKPGCSPNDNTDNVRVLGGLSDFDVIVIDGISYAIAAGTHDNGIEIIDFSCLEAAR